MHCSFLINESCALHVSIGHMIFTGFILTIRCKWKAKTQKDWLSLSCGCTIFTHFEYSFAVKSVWISWTIRALTNVFQMEMFCKTVYGNLAGYSKWPITESRLCDEWTRKASGHIMPTSTVSKFCGCTWKFEGEGLTCLFMNIKHFEMVVFIIYYHYKTSILHGLEVAFLKC